MDIGYVAVEKFNPPFGEVWNKYIKFSGLKHLVEVVSLDGCLCPTLINKFGDDEYNHMIYVGSHCGIFNDLQWVINKSKGKENVHVLAILFNPDCECSEILNDYRFSFCGYDLVDDYPNGISALVNCGGFEGVFGNEDISSMGLIKDYKRAKEIQKQLIINYPDEEHAYCELWAIWKMVSAC